MDQQSGFIRLTQHWATFELLCTIGLIASLFISTKGFFLGIRVAYQINPWPEMMGMNGAVAFWIFVVILLVRLILLARVSLYDI